MFGCNYLLFSDPRRDRLPGDVVRGERVHLGVVPDGVVRVADHRSADVLLLVRDARGLGGGREPYFN